MTTTELYLLLIAFALFAAVCVLITLRHFDSREADQLAQQLRDEQARVRHYQTRNAELRAELATGQSKGGRRLTAIWTTYLDSLPVTSPEDPR
ncbi:hypothetical protein [Micromonospora chersina]|uniref:hypothetical protein n=1 Tax=Micromonospora chersina TaxID=47854 RepID=UPI00340D9A17